MLAAAVRSVLVGAEESSEEMMRKSRVEVEEGGDRKVETGRWR